MIKAYLVGISTHYEGEDIEVRYRIYQDQELKCQKSVFQRYVKPAIVNQTALRTLLKDLDSYVGEEIIVVMNDAAIEEQIRGTSQTKNKDVLKMSKTTKEELDKFNNRVSIQDVSGKSKELKQWGKELDF